MGGEVYVVWCVSTREVYVCVGGCVCGTYTFGRVVWA